MHSYHNTKQVMFSFPSRKKIITSLPFTAAADEENNEFKFLKKMFKAILVLELVVVSCRILKASLLAASKTFA